MKEIYSSPDLTLIYHLKNVLETQGIESMVQGQDRVGALGGIAPVDAWPELWLTDDSRLDEARQMIEEALETDEAEGAEQPAWKCSECGEELEAQFTECWKCGAARK